MTLTEFEIAAVPFFKQIHEAMRADTGTIASMTDVGRALALTLNFLGDVYATSSDAELRAQAETTAQSIAAALIKNTEKIYSAQQAEAELELAMAECAQQFVTIH